MFAFEWICDECGRNSFKSLVTEDLTDEQKENDPDYGFNLTFPATVTCDHCKTEFRVSNLDNLV
jgi:hypothetical protein